MLIYTLLYGPYTFVQTLAASDVFANITHVNWWISVDGKDTIQTQNTNVYVGVQSTVRTIMKSTMTASDIMCSRTRTCHKVVSVTPTESQLWTLTLVRKICSNDNT